MRSGTRTEFLPRTPWRLLRGAALCFALALVAGPALAGTYYVATTGNDANAGNSSGAPWRTIAKANTTLNAGDVVFISPGVYTDPIKPVRNGTSNTQRISYVGSLSTPSLITVKDIWLERQYISVKGVTSSASFTFYYTSESAKAVYDSIAWCVALTGGCGFAGAKNSSVSNSTINGNVSFMMNNWYAIPPGNVASIADTLLNNTIHIGTIQLKGFQMRGFTQYCVVERNRIDALFSAATGGDVQGRYIYNSYYNTFRDNSWRIEADGPLLGNQYTGFALRDSSHHNLFERDTMMCGVQSGYDIGGRLVNAGNAPWVGQCIGNRWKDCFFLTTGNVFNQDIMDGTIIEGTVFASLHSYGLYILGPIKNTIIRNCTFASWSGPSVKLEGDPRGGGNQFYSNIFYTEQVGPCLSGKAVLFLGYTTGFSQNNNLFFSRTAQAGVTPANQSLYWSSSSCSAPGPGTSWASATGNDVNSRYGDPKFVSTAFQTFNPHITAGSLALGLGQGGVDAGAFPFAGGAADVTPPATINNLTAAQVNDNNVLLSWTAPGDDGTSGVAAAYDLRSSTSPITAENFASATPVSVQPIPVVPGTVQTYAMLGLMPNTAYYFAIRTRDEVNNWSAVSNVISPTTVASDTRAPSNVNDLSSP